MIADSTMRLGRFEFAVVRAEFCFIVRGPEPVTWDLNVYGHCINENDAHLFPAGIMLSAEGVPLTLSPTEDYTGFALHTPAAKYPDSGQSYFALWIDGEYETWDVDLRLVERRGESYLLKFQATTEFALQDEHQQLRISAWAENVPWRSAPKTDYARWLRWRQRP